MAGRKAAVYERKGDSPFSRIHRAPALPTNENGRWGGFFETFVSRTNNFSKREQIFVFFLFNR